MDIEIGIGTFLDTLLVMGLACLSMSLVSRAVFGFKFGVCGVGHVWAGEVGKGTKITSQKNCGGISKKVIKRGYEVGGHNYIFCASHDIWLYFHLYVS